MRIKKASIFLFILCTIVFGVNVAFAQTTKTVTKKTTSTNKNNCEKVGQGTYQYDKCKTPGGVTELRGYTCESKDSKGNVSRTQIPVCTVGGIFDLNDPDDLKCACCGQCPLSRFLGVFIKISKWILGLSGTAALAVIVYGGFMWILSGGDPKKIETGKNALTGAVIGVIIVLGAWLIVNEALKAMTGGKGINEIQQTFEADKK